MKTCLKCNEKKEFSEFGKDKQKKDSLNTYCKSCIKIRSGNQRKNNPEYGLKYFKIYREKNRDALRKESARRFLENKKEWLRKQRESYHRRKEEISKRRKLERLKPGSREKNRLRIAEWREKNKDKFRKTVRKWQTANREKCNAHAKVHTAIKNGTLKKSMKCQECKIKCLTEGHHEDYSKPLEVIWLCRKCHALKIEKVKV